MKRFILCLVLIMSFTVVPANASPRKNCGRISDPYYNDLWMVITYRMPSCATAKHWARVALNHPSWTRVGNFRRRHYWGDPGWRFQGTWDDIYSRRTFRITYAEYNP